NPITLSRNVLEKEVRNPLTGTIDLQPMVTMSAEFIDHFWLPSVERVIDATSATRTLIRHMEKGGRQGIPTAVQALKYTSEAATAVFKPLILTMRIPALILRTQGEQALRNRAYGYKAFVFQPADVTS